MPLSDKQRAWLDAALSSKGRFTRKKTIRKQFDEYIRRRDKTSQAWAALPKDHPDYTTIDNGVKAADALADQGNLRAAYDQLDTIKALAKASGSARGNLIMLDAIRLETDRLGRELGQQIVEVKEARALVTDLFASIAAAPKASGKTTLEEALEFRAAFVAEEARLRALYAATIQEGARISQLISARALGPQLERLGQDIAAVKVSGRHKEVAPYESRHGNMQASWNSDEFYSDPDKVRMGPGRREAEFERLLMACKSLEKWQVREGDASRPDARTGKIRSNLSRDNEARLALINREEERLARARAEFMKQYARDQAVFQDTSTGVINVTPEPPRFDPGDTLADLAGDEAIGDVVTDKQARHVARTAAARLKAFVTDRNTDKNKLFDLSLRSRDELKSMIAKDVLGTTNAEDWTETQRAMLDKAAEDAEKALCKHLPNRMADDGSEITVNGVKYKHPVVLKQGGKGKATRYTAQDGSTIVVKTLLSASASDREDMVREMETHHRAMEGRDPLATRDSIVELHGAARSPDGSLHMVLEDVDGGDLDDLNNGLSAASHLGLIPDEARRAIAMQNLLNTVRALKDLERQGLVHHDIKGENVMMTSDGSIKIIDYGEAAFLDGQGKIDGPPTASTKGYQAPEIFYSDSHNTRVDVYAISGMLQRLVADMRPGEDPQKKKLESGALGRLVGALSDPDPSKRPSLDAILQSSMATSYERDYNRENVKDLQKASLDFAVQAASVKADIDVATLKSKLGEAGNDIETPMKLKKAQDMVSYLNAEIAKVVKEAMMPREVGTSQGVDNYLTTKRHKLEELKRDLAILQSEIINPMLEKAVADSKAAYQSALDDTAKKVEIKVQDGTKKMSLKDAVSARDELAAKCADYHDRMMKLLNVVEDSQGLRERVDKFNVLITKLDDARQRIDDVIYAAVGPQARFFLAKVKLEKAASAFGATASPKSEEGVEDKTGLDQMLSDLMTFAVRDELEKASV